MIWHLTSFSLRFIPLKGSLSFSPAEYIYIFFFWTISAAVPYLFPFVPRFLRFRVYSNFIRYSITFEKRETKDREINVFENEKRIFVSSASWKGFVKHESTNWSPIIGFQPNAVFSAMRHLSFFLSLFLFFFLFYSLSLDKRDVYSQTIFRKVWISHQIFQTW